MPSLQLHMLRVAAVAHLLADACTQPVDTKAIVTACLLHDMGNIAKFDLQRFPDFLQPEGLVYWQAQKEAFVEKYGPNPHHATVAIAQELRVNDRVLELIDAIGFNQARRNYDSLDFSRKIAAYSDMRVAPEGVTSLEARLADAQVRYHQPGKKETFNYVMRAFLRKIEQQLAAESSVAMDQITEEKVSPLFSKLRRWQLA